MRWSVCWTLLFLLVLAAEGLFAMQVGDEDVFASVHHSMGKLRCEEVKLGRGQIRSDTSLDTSLLPTASSQDRRAYHNRWDHADHA
jgi:hypothetical protein